MSLSGDKLATHWKSARGRRRIVHDGGPKPPLAGARPRPQWSSTLCLIAGLLFTGLFLLRGDTASAVARHAAWGVAFSVCVSLWLEFRQQWTNLLRTDLVALTALYFLVFFEFLFAQPRFNELVPNPMNIKPSIVICLAAFGAMATGRHLVSRRIRPLRLATTALPQSAILTLFWFSLALGYFHMLLASDFNVVAMVGHFLDSRFAVPWGRGKFGDAKAMLYEMGATLYLVPPLAGVILGRRRSYGTSVVVAVFAALIVTLFYGFCTGTRNVIGIYLMTFLAAYYYASGGARTSNLVLGASAGLILLASTVYGVRFRKVGLGEYLKDPAAYSATDDIGIYVDYNLWSLLRVTEIFPQKTPYLGWKVPTWLLARPVPRFLWPGKPDGQDVSPETHIGFVGATVTATFIGDTYMAAGIWGVMVAGLGLGWLWQWWTQKAFSLKSDFGIVIYGSGFFAASITMRSLYMLPVAVLPTVTALVMGWLFSSRVHAGSIRKRRNVASKS